MCPKGMLSSGEQREGGAYRSWYHGDVRSVLVPCCHIVLCCAAHAYVTHSLSLSLFMPATLLSHSSSLFLTLPHSSRLCPAPTTQTAEMDQLDLFPSRRCNDGSPEPLLPPTLLPVSAATGVSCAATQQ